MSASLVTKIGTVSGGHSHELGLLPEVELPCCGLSMWDGRTAQMHDALWCALNTLLKRKGCLMGTTVESRNEGNAHPQC